MTAASAYPAVLPAWNVLDEPWIPVRDFAGKVHHVGIADALLRAAEWSDLAVTEPPSYIAMHRLLLAVVHRALTGHHGKWTTRDRARWIVTGIPAAPLQAYFLAWRDRFWVFHPTHPFMQVAALASAAETADKLRPWTLISMASSSGNTPVVFDHAVDTVPSSQPIRLALLTLLGFLQCATGGLVKTFRDSDKAGPLSNTAAVLPRGKSLAQTYMLALHPFRTQDLDLPTWERSPPQPADLSGPATLATGPNDRYTRLARAVLFSPNATTTHVEHLRFGAGVALLESDLAPDPMAAYRINKDGKPIRLRFEEGRASWRDLPSLLPEPAGKTAIPPAVLSWAADLVEASGEPVGAEGVVVAGIASNQAKLERWRLDWIVLPNVLLADAGAAQEVRAQIARAEALHGRVQAVCVRLLAALMPDPNHKDTRARATQLLQAGPTTSVFYAAIERALPEMLSGIASAARLSDADAVATTHKVWTDACTSAARSAWSATRATLGKSTRVLRADAKVYPLFFHILKEFSEHGMSQTAVVTPTPSPLNEPGEREHE